MEKIAPGTGNASLKRRGGRARDATGDASQARCRELFTKAIGGERPDFAQEVADVAADPARGPAFDRPVRLLSSSNLAGKS